MPFTREQIIAAQAGLGHAVANNPKNISNPISVSTTPESGVTPYGGVVEFFTPTPAPTPAPTPSPSPEPSPEPNPRPTGGGSSVISEPDLGTPIGSGGSIGGGGGAIGGGGIFGGGGGGGGASETDGGGVVPEKPNYVLYIGILLAVIIAYKVLSKKTPKT